MEVILTCEELENIIKAYYAKKYELNVEVSIHDFSFGGDYYSDIGLTFSKTARVTKNMHIFGLDKEVTEELEQSDIEEILKELIDSEYVIDRFLYGSGYLKIIYEKKGQKRIKSL